MKKDKTALPGSGRQVPPEMAHVLIYFIQKGLHESVAVDFYTVYSMRKWLNRKGQRIKDWKMHAWEWIWHR